MNDDTNVEALLLRVAQATESIKLKVEEVEKYRFRIVALDDYTEQALEALAGIGAFTAGDRQRNLAILLMLGLETTMQMQMGEEEPDIETQLQSGHPECIALYEDSVALLQKELRDAVDRLAAHQGLDRNEAVHAVISLGLAGHLADGLAVPARSVVH